MLDVLFVDDEPLALKAICALLHKKRHEWNMHFLTSGSAALEHIASHPVDVLVSDLRMVTGMSGYGLLREVAHRHPRITRIVLSGTISAYSPELTALAHAILTKPCDRTALERAVASARRPTRIAMNTHTGQPAPAITPPRRQ